MSTIENILIGYLQVKGKLSVKVPKVTPLNIIRKEILWTTI